jgi:hypothetical protein
MEKRVYTYCPHVIADLIIAVNVDNGTCRLIDLTCSTFLKLDGRINMQREVIWCG